MLLEQSVLSPASYTRHFSLFATCFFCLFFLEDIHYLGFSFSWAISHFLNEIYFNSLKFQSRLGAKCCLQKIHLQPARHRCLSLCGVGNPNSISISMNFFFVFLFLAQFCFLLLILLLTGFLALAENSKSYSLCQPLVITSLLGQVQDLGEFPTAVLSAASKSGKSLHVLHELHIISPEHGRNS